MVPRLVPVQSAPSNKVTVAAIALEVKASTAVEMRAMLKYIVRNFGSCGSMKQSQFAVQDRESLYDAYIVDTEEELPSNALAYWTLYFFPNDIR